MATAGRLEAPALPAGGSRISWKRIVLPSEHGSWGFLAEPLLLGLLAAPSGAGAALARGPFPAKRLGWGEVAAGLAAVLLAAAAWRIAGF